MKWSLIAVGKPKLPFARAGINEYLHRLQRVAATEFITVKSGTPATESAALLARSDGAYRIVLDERGRTFTSPEFAHRIRDLQLAGHRHFAVLIGGADGHHDSLRQSADLLLSLSRLTLQHELALLLTAEQIYRAHSILAGSPYHRE